MNETREKRSENEEQNERKSRGRKDYLAAEERCKNGNRSTDLTNTPNNINQY